MQMKTKKKFLIFMLSVLLLSIFWLLPSKNIEIVQAETDTSSSEWVIEGNKIISYLGQDAQVTVLDSYNGIDVTEIGDYAFADNPFLVSVEFSDTISKIGKRAFENCSNLATVQLPNVLSDLGEYAFNNCVSLKEIIIPGTLKNIGGIGGYIFNGCQNLESAVIQEGVETIGEYAFYQCKNLKSIELPSTLQKIDTWAFGYCENLQTIVFPQNLKSIGSAAFYYCNTLNNIVIPNSVNEIGTHSFRGCWNLSSLTLSTSLKTIPYRAFSGCIALTNVELFEGLQSIGDEAFYEAGIQQLILPEGLEIIGKDAFVNNTRLLNVKFPSTLKALKERAFANCSSLKEVVFADGLSVIENNAFKNCGSLTKISFPKTLTRIGNNAFENCINLYSICLPTALKSIENEAFKGNYRLIEIFNLSSIEIIVGDINNNGSIGAFVQCVHTSLEDSCIFIDDEGYVFYNNQEKKLLGYTGEQSELILPESFFNDTYEIAAYAFYKKSSIISIQIPKTVTKIGKNSFQDCTNLGTINYLGNAKEWALIEIADGNNCLEEVFCWGKYDEDFGGIDEDFNYIPGGEEDISFIDFLADLGHSFVDALVEHIFVVNFVFILLWGIILLYGNPKASNKTKKRNKLIFVLIACTQWVLISGLRADSVGDDTKNYMLFFDRHGSLSWSTIFNGLKNYITTGKMSVASYMDVEPLFIVFNKCVSVFTTNHIIYKFLIAIIFMSSLGLYIYRYSKDPCLSFILYGALFFNMFSLTGYRQVLSVSLILFGFRFIKERKLFPFLCILFFAYFLHRTTLIFILLYIFADKKITPIYVIAILVGLIGMIVLRKQLFATIKVFMGYEEYVGNYGFKQQTFALLFTALTAVAAWRYKYVLKKDATAIQYYNGLILSWLMFPLAMESPSCMRLVYDFGFVWLLLVPLLVQSFKSKEDRLIAYIGIYAVFGIQVLTSGFAYALFWQ